MRLANAATALVRIGYVTDVEGNLGHFGRYVERSGVLKWKGDELALVDEGCHFVYGGDVVDKGPGDLRLCELLVKLKRRYPERVWLLVGNRDLNKLRMTAELSEQALAVPAAEVPGPHWDEAAPTLAEYLEREALADSKKARLKWMLTHTLGCGETFEYRREELEVLKQRAVTDAEVTESFVDAIKPGGALKAYLDEAHVAVRLGQTLFVHGAVDRLSAGYVPTVDAEFRVGCPDDPAFPPTKLLYETVAVDRWIDGLNALLKAGLRDHEARPDFDDLSKSRRRGGECLMALQNRCAVWGRSVVSNAYADGGLPDSEAAKKRRDKTWAKIHAFRENIRDCPATVFEASTGYTSDCLDEKVARWLLASNIRRVVVGHRPCGDSPAVLDRRYHGVEIVTVDTSYSDVTAPDNRGLAVPAPLIVGDSFDSNRLVLSGVLKDGREYSGVFPLLQSTVVDDTDADPLLGTVDDQGWWYKATLVGSDAYLQCRGQGRRIDYRDLRRGSVDSETPS